MPSTLIHKRAAGGSSTKPFLSKKRKAGVKKILSSFDRTAKKLIKRLVALEVQALDPEIKVCGLLVKEADVKYMMRRMAKRVKKLEADRESLRKSSGFRSSFSRNAKEEFE